MKESIKNRKKKFLALCLSALMFSSVAALASCSDSNATDSSSSSSSTTSEEKDTGLIKNAGFETFNTENAINTSTTGWSRSVNSASSGSALSSKAASGIIDLSEDAWKNLTGSYYENPDDVLKLSEAEAEKVWDKLTVRDKLAYYDQWKADHKDGKIASDLKFYESINIDSGDIPQISRFDTHHQEGEEGYGEDSKVLMIHNEYPEADSTATYRALGTAQKYTSSSTVTIAAGSSAKFSVWVRTEDLKSSSTAGDPQEAVNKGAYISITHSVGGKTLDEYKVENINTENMDEGTLSNGWKQYTFIIKGSSYSDTTFSVVLGLGQGGGTYRGEYVNGYAFFDDIECEIISNDTFDGMLTEYSIDANDVVGFDAEGEEKVVDVAATENVDRAAFAMDFYGEFDQINNILANATSKATTSEVAGETVSSLKGQNPAKWLNGGFDGSKDVNAVFANAEAIQNGTDINGNTYTDNAFLQAVYNNYFANNEFSKDKQTLLLMSAKGAAYTADLGYNFELRTPIMNDDGTQATDSEGKKQFEKIEYLALSFFVKTSDLNGYTGASISLVDGNNKTTFSSMDTTSITPVKIEGNEDVYEGWQQCFFFIKNASDDATISTEDDSVTSFTLSFNFGPTEIQEATAIDSYHPGFAAFTDFKVYSMSKTQYESAQSGSYAKLVSVMGGKEEEKTVSGGFDSPAGVPSKAIETGLANLQSYKGVYSNSAYITGGIHDDTTYNQHENAGLLSKDYFTAEDGYFTTATGAWMDGIKSLAAAGADATTVWNTVFGKGVTRPLFIWNDGSNDGKAYGYIGNSTTISANSYSAISVRVKASVGAKASVYLIDTNGEKYDTTLSIGRNLTYWYDDDGNICTGDPSEKATQVAFKLQTNGLYKVNKYWDGYDASMDNLWFANLEGYAEDPVTHNKLVSKGGAYHEYNDYWNNEGLDGVAYYYNAINGKYYADRALTIPVTNLKDITALAPRYTATANEQKMQAVIEGTGEWTTVTFYVHTGDTAKNYRLEVWSGVRSGAGNEAGSYVIFDSYNPGTAESNFTGLLEEYEDKVSDDNKFYGVFSYYDTASYLRYDASMDEKGDGDLYKENYIPSSYSEGIAYLCYETEDEYTVFADYQYSEKTVTKSAVQEDVEVDTDDEETEAETNIWLLASSLAIAIILVFVVISILVRKIMKYVRKKRMSQTK